MLRSGRFGRFALGCLAALAAIAPARAQTKPLPPLVFTGIPDQDESRLVERFGKVATYLESKLGVPVRYLPVKSDPAAVTAFTNGPVQRAGFGGVTGVQARRAVPGAQAIAQGAEDAAFKTDRIANTAARLKAGRVVRDAPRRNSAIRRGSGPSRRPRDARPWAVFRDRVRFGRRRARAPARPARR